MGEENEIYPVRVVKVQQMDAPALIPTQHQNLKPVAKFLCKKIYPQFGLPDSVMSDKGGHFVSQVIQAMMKT